MDNKDAKERQEAWGNLSGCFSALASLIGFIILIVVGWMVWDALF